MKVYITPAGWATRKFTLEEFERFIQKIEPRLVELSKDFLRDDVSMKSLGSFFDRYRQNRQITLVYAGTTDLVSCNGMSWDRYLQYVAIQVAQAKFLGCSLFRVLVGQSAIETADDLVIRRLIDFCNDAFPMEVCIEIHSGPESDLELLERIIDETPAKIVIDFENMLRAGLRSGDLVNRIPPERIAYFHQRNLGDIWQEHVESLEDEVFWQQRMPEAVFLWEPKKIDESNKIQEIYLEYRKVD